MALQIRHLLGAVLVVVVGVSTFLLYCPLEGECHSSSATVGLKAIAKTSTSCLAVTVTVIDWLRSAPVTQCWWWAKWQEHP